MRALIRSDSLEDIPSMQADVDGTYKPGVIVSNQ